MIITPGDFDIAWRTVWMEARDQGYAGQCAVAHVMHNRLVWKTGDRWSTLAQVCLDWLQFSGWREQDPNFQAALRQPLDDIAQQCAMAVLEALSADFDPTKGSRHYYSHRVLPVPPKWAVGKVSVATIKDHHFFNDIA